MYDRLGIFSGVLKERTSSTFVAPGRVAALVMFTVVRVVG